MQIPDDPVGAVAALDEPTRRRLYDYIARSRQPVGRDQAARALGIARVTAAFHLDRLAAQGLLEVSHQRLTGRSGPGAGRPAKLYRRAGGELAVALPPRQYDLAGALLAEAIEASETLDVTPREALARRAREHGAALARPPADPADHVDRTGPVDPVGVLVDAGFEPYQDDGILRLANCPFHRLAAAHPALVCGMNLHLIEGLLDAIPGSPYTATLDPGPDRCCVALNPT